MRSSRLQRDPRIDIDRPAGRSSSHHDAARRPGVAANVERWTPFLVAGLLAAAVLAPSVRVSARLDGMRIELLAWTIAVPYLVMAWIVPAYRRAHRDGTGRPGELLRTLGVGPVDVGFLALGLATLGSMLWAPLALGEPAGPRDAFELVKLALYWVAFRTALLVAGHDPSHRRALVVFLAAGSLAALVALAQYADPFGVAARTGGWWAPAHHLRALERDGRAFGTVGNPNYFGALMAMLAVTALHVAAFGARGRLRRLAVAALLLAPLGVVLSGSRGAIGMLIAGVVVSWAASTPGVRSRPRILLPALAAGVAVVASVALVELVPRGREPYLARVAGAFSPAGDSAIALRLERWRGAAGIDRPDGGDEAATLIVNGDLERAAGDGAARFRTIPGTEYELSSGAARSGSAGIVYRGNPDQPGRRAAVYQQRAIGRRIGGPLTASVWVNVRPAARGDVFLYTNLFYTDGTREDPHARAAADPTLADMWQRLAVELTPDPNRSVDFVGVYLLSDEFAGEVWADGFELVTSETTAASDEAAQSGDAANDAVSQVRRSPLFGGGPRAGEGSTLDNEYLSVAQRYGLLGLAAYLALWTATALAGWRSARRGNAIAVAVVGIVAGLLLFDVVAGSLYHLQLMAVFWPLAGVLLAAPQAGGRVGTADH